MLGNLFKRFDDALGGQLSKMSADKNFLEGVMAGAAIMTMADGSASAAEKLNVSEFIRKHPSMEHFDKIKAVQLYNNYLGNFDLDIDIGADDCLREMAEVKGEDKRKLMVRVAIMVGKADKDFGDAEKAAARRMISFLNLNPADFTL